MAGPSFALPSAVEEPASVWPSFSIDYMHRLARHSDNHSPGLFVYATAHASYLEASPPPRFRPYTRSTLHRVLDRVPGLPPPTSHTQRTYAHTPCGKEERWAVAAAPARLIAQRRTRVARCVAVVGRAPCGADRGRAIMYSV
ncbi:hypothetical protein S40293_11141 [Stachybotrys chartarum IBT 40293]|nr:hypothetical protein S40293_11141 [Stachybotrys chartarum IBT 40293]KFA71656.1 hypothetical protein S40288_10831 [Stachybotrys chartarum IBT 40288]